MQFLSAGESHGKGLSIMLEDVPAGLHIDVDFINHQLWRRQQGYGRGGRMQIETDTVEIMSGVRFGVTTGAPVALWIKNRDYANWENIMDPLAQPSDISEKKSFHRPRPGHADLAGHYKYGLDDLRDVLERSSARETASRVAAGAIAQLLLQQVCGVEFLSHVIELGSIKPNPNDIPTGFTELKQTVESNDLRCAGSEALLAEMRAKIDAAQEAGVTLGGRIEVIGVNIPAGLGSYVQWNRRLDGQLAQAVMSIQAVKSVSIGYADLAPVVTGNLFHDGIHLNTDNNTIERTSNNAGGLEGGVTNGQPLIVQAIMKPISTMRTPIESVNLKTMSSEKAHFERSDVTAVAACGVIAEAMVALTVANALQHKYGSDSVSDIKQHLKASSANKLQLSS